jgi:hypothetical protein
MQVAPVTTFKVTKKEPLATLLSLIHTFRRVLGWIEIGRFFDDRGDNLLVSNSPPDLTLNEA